MHIDFNKHQSQKLSINNVRQWHRLPYYRSGILGSCSALENTLYKLNQSDINMTHDIKISQGRCRQVTGELGRGIMALMPEKCLL